MSGIVIAYIPLTDKVRTFRKLVLTAIVEARRKLEYDLRG